MNERVNQMLEHLREAVALESEAELSHRLLREELATSSYREQLDGMIGESKRHRKMVRNLLKLIKTI
jgi:rubrerythrin